MLKENSYTHLYFSLTPQFPLFGYSHFSFIPSLLQEMLPVHTYLIRTINNHRFGREYCGNRRESILVT